MKKSIVISLLTVTTLCCTAICSFASTGIVTTDTLNLREEPSTESSIIALLSINDEIEILEEEYGWYKVQSGDKVGYVASQYINVLTETNEENLNKDNNNEEEINTNTPVTVTSENVNNTGTKVKVLKTGEKIYITPLVNSLIIEELEEDKQIEVTSEISGWSYVKIGTLSGWVRTEKIEEKDEETNASNPVNNSNNNTSSQKTGYISGTSVNFRKTANTSGEIIRKLKINTQITIIAEDDDWTQIEYDGDTGYVATEYISNKEVETTSRSAAPAVATKTANTTNETTVSSAEEKVSTGEVTGSDVVAYAKQYLGYKYTSGGSSPSAGFDCSGFTTYVYKHFGISLARTSSGQSGNGVGVSRENLALRRHYMFFLIKLK